MKIAKQSAHWLAKLCSVALSDKFGDLSTGGQSNQLNCKLDTQREENDSSKMSGLSSE